VRWEEASLHRLRDVVPALNADDATATRDTTVADRIVFHDLGTPERLRIIPTRSEQTVASSATNVGDRVMSRCVGVVKRFLIPGSMTFLMAGFAVGVALLNAGGLPLRVGRVWLTSLLGLYWLLSLPVTAEALIQKLQHRYGSVRTAQKTVNARVLVVVGNGAVHYKSAECRIDQLTRRSAFCVFEAARLCRLFDPAWVVATGGSAEADEHARTEAELMRDELVRLEVPPDRILVESASRNTEEQVANVARLLERRGLGGRILVVTTGAHMPRVMKLFHDRRIDAIPSVASVLRYDAERTPWRRWYPSSAALRGSESAIYEYLARAYAAIHAARD
jgi:uncharacterized SAM-binding protein YcdF (DUF218 family)